MFDKIILIGIFALQATIIWFARKINSASNIFFEKKAENLATKQDVKSITRKTEEVHEEFKKGFSEFEKDLEYHRKLYECQYKELYSKLFNFLCRSEALRFVAKKTNPELDLDIDFSRCPIVDVDKVSGDSIIEEIVTLVNENIAYASPSLILLCQFFTITNDKKKNTDATNAKILEQEILDLKKEISIEIINGYYNLLEILRLKNEKNKYMRSSETVFEYEHPHN